MKTYLLLLFSTLFLLPGQLLAQHHNLDFYLQQARANSPFIQQNKNEKRLIQLDIEQLKSIYSKPVVTADASVLFAPIVARDNGSSQFKLATKDAKRYTGYDLATTDGGQYVAGVTVTQGLFNGKKLDTHDDKADIRNRISDNNIELTLHELENAVKHQYLLCLKSKKQADSNQQLIKEVENEIATMKPLVQNAIYKQSDLKLLQITLQNYQQAYETFQADYRDNIYNLNLLCGVNEGADTEIEPVAFHLSPVVTSGSRFLTSFYLDSLSIVADRKISELKYQPQVNLFANAGMNATYVPSINRLGFSTGATFSLTLFDGHQRKLKAQKAKINLETLQFKMQNRKKEINIQRKFTLDKLASLNKRISLATRQLEQYNELLKMYKSELSQASISVMDYKYLLKDISTKKQENLLLEMEKQMVINAWNYWNY